MFGVVFKGRFIYISFMHVNDLMKEPQIRNSDLEFEYRR
jgi:hypothetical protein